MTMRYAESLRCALRAGYSVYGLQQLAHDTLAEAARIDEADQDRLDRIKILQEMQGQVALHGKEWMSLWLAIRRIESDRFTSRYRRTMLKRRWSNAIPAAFAAIVESILYDDCSIAEEDYSPRAQFLGTLVITGDISASEYSLGMLGQEFLAIEGDLHQLTLHFGKNEAVRSRTITTVHDPYIPRR